MTVRTRATVRTVSSAALAVAALGALAGCSAGAAQTGSTSSDAASGGTSSSSAAAGTSSSAAAEAGGATGTYTATGEYQTPGGQESVEVTLGVADGVVETVEVVGSGGSPNSEQYQSQFIAGIDAVAVGQALATLEVGAVSGSSLTSQGFNAAVEQIRADAA